MRLNESESLLLLEQLLNQSFRWSKPPETPSAFLDDSTSIHWLGGLFTFMGTVSLLLNVGVMCLLLRYRSTLLRHVFYILIFNFAIIDGIKGVCTIAYAMNLLMVADAGAANISFKLDQLVLLLHRVCNLATILNLAFITGNELLYCVSFYYETVVTRNRAIGLVVLSWLVSITFTVVILLLGSSAQAVLIDPMCGVLESANCFVRQDTSVDSQKVFHVGIIAFCVVCLLAIIVSYVILYRVVARIVKTDKQLSKEANGFKRRSLSGDSQTQKRPSLGRRHRYVIVIGVVIGVCTVYLISYSALQLMQILRFSSGFSLSEATTLRLKWILRFALCVHSLIQPLCYLRMKEFRNVVSKLFCRRKSMEMLTEHEEIATRLEFRSMLNSVDKEDR
ncbi:hypothetical protein QR680_009319 [Steinernema hermaphroditum]|uniref:G-protein coupled receptors family 1 profile domain-containing protein n=1 Tax=Steinernema hermaphroditum TaxID=289476 RepID=A0AA39IJW0_9BILA|nr:hypothetical protein QR680_009319 [Steinernema hermaphroditum]